MDKKLKVRTIIFTEACPLNCRYCDLKNDSNFGESPTMTKEQVFQLVDTFDKQDDPALIDTRILFSGGEPLLYWPWIKEIIEKYQHRFQYAFNTSGYLFTEEMLEFLSNYTVNFVLSVDGNEALTNYLRPTNDTPYRTGYFKRLKEILPTLLFYFPRTPFRIIIHPRYVDMLYEMYVEATRLGFKYFTYILDFESRPGRILDKKNKKTIEWEEKHTKILFEQVDLILTDIIEGFIKGIARPQMVEINKVVEFLLNKQPFNPDNLPCKIFNNRSLSVLYSTDREDNSTTHCFSGSIQDLNEVKAMLIEAYNKHNHICSKDSDCQAFDYCALTCCPQMSYMQRSGFFDFDDLECVVNKVSYYAALKLLTIANEMCPKSPLYQQYINDFDYPGKKEVLQ